MLPGILHSSKNEFTSRSQILHEHQRGLTIPEDLNKVCRAWSLFAIRGNDRVFANRMGNETVALEN
jgi:hypothetical protein